MTSKSSNARDDVDETITEAIAHADNPVPVLHVSPSSTVMAQIPDGKLPPPEVESPSRGGRKELHVTAPQESRRTPPDGLPAQPKARVLGDDLPLFNETAETLGLDAFLPAPATPDITSALRSIYAYSEQSRRQACQVTERARNELLWERAREYDQMEAERRAKHPLTRTVRMM